MTIPRLIGSTCGRSPRAGDTGTRYLTPMPRSLFVSVVVRPRHGSPRPRHRPRPSAPRDPAGQPARTDLLRGRLPGDLPRPPGRADVPPPRRSVGLLPDAQPRPPDPDAARR